MQLELNIPLHQRENNRESEDFLNENRKKFSSQCSLLLSELRKGKRISVMSAMQDYKIHSLPRRIKDMTDAGIIINSEWVKIDGEAKFKEWFI